MTVNVETDLDEQIEKCVELLKKYEELESHVKQLHFITVKEFAEMRGCSLSIARKIFGLPDFPRRRLSAKNMLFLWKH